jgi:molybdate transport system ATP-binding protein
MSCLAFDVAFRYRSGFQCSLQFDTQGGTTALIGPSGSGKTSVLNLIAGLLTPDKGSIRFGDRVLFDASQGIDVRPEKRFIGYVFQDYLLFPHLTVKQNLLYGFHRAVVAKIAFEQVIEVMRLESFLHRYPITLSGGQLQRVAVGRAILSSPQLLLLDEPLSAVDETHRVELLAFLSETISKFAIPTILVSHDMAGIGRIASQVISMKPPELH